MAGTSPIALLSPELPLARLRSEERHYRVPSGHAASLDVGRTVWRTYAASKAWSTFFDREVVCGYNFPVDYPASVARRSDFRDS